jgi:hypothetical protein
MPPVDAGWHRGLMDAQQMLSDAGVEQPGAESVLVQR